MPRAPRRASPCCGAKSRVYGLDIEAGTIGLRCTCCGRERTEPLHPPEKLDPRLRREVRDAEIRRSFAKGYTEGIRELKQEHPEQWRGRENVIPFPSKWRPVRELIQRPEPEGPKPTG